VTALGLLNAERTPEVIWLGGTLAWVINWPHFSATNYRLYHSRENVRQYPMTALLVPLVVGVGVIASFVYPAAIAPYFVKLFVIWSPYHFSGQTVGITLLYCRRAGFSIDRWERLALATFVYGTFLAPTLAAETGSTYQMFYGVQYPAFGVPLWAPKVASGIMAAGGLAFVALAVRWTLREGRMLPPIVLLPAVTQFVWFVGGSGLAGFREFVPLFHSLQYLLIAWSMQLRERLDEGGQQPGLRFVAQESGRWGAINFVGGAMLFSGLPLFASQFGIDLPIATGVVFAGVQIHHFFVDGVIWRLKSKAVSSPLMGNIEELLRPVAVRSAPRLAATGTS
jgi:hypothetical protein